MPTRSDLQGPPRYLADHPAVWALSLAGASGAAAAFVVRAARARRLRRCGWAALALLELGIAAGILSLRLRRPSRKSRYSTVTVFARFLGWSTLRPLMPAM